MDEITDSNFLSALKDLLQHEGGFVNDADDPGGATNYGITLGYLQSQGVIDGDIDGDGKIDWLDVKALTVNEAAELYYHDWWLKFGYDKFEFHVARKMLDMAVNMGAPRAHKIVQKALNSLGENLDVDGVLGPSSKTAIKIHDVDLLPRIREEQEKFYRGLVAKNPALEKFLKGWLNRTAY